MRSYCTRSVVRSVIALPVIVVQYETGAGIFMPGVRLLRRTCLMTRPGGIRLVERVIG